MASDSEDQDRKKNKSMVDNPKSNIQLITQDRILQLRPKEKKDTLRENAVQSSAHLAKPTDDTNKEADKLKSKESVSKIATVKDVPKDKHTDGHDTQGTVKPPLITVEHVDVDRMQSHSVDAQEDDKDIKDPDDKKKKKKKSSGKNKKPTPSGFEEFYADTPVSPTEYLEESQDVYHPSRPFVERIEHCIQRYRLKRKFDSERANIFNKYLTLGGVDSSMKQFTGGLDRETLDENTAPEIAAIQAQDYIRTGTGSISRFYDPACADDWVVDFEGVVKGFLSERAPRVFGLESPQVINQFTSVIRNFLNYVLMHNVCPEHAHNILAARKICDLAETELWSIRQLSGKLPGKFNAAASMLCGGYHAIANSSSSSGGSSSVWQPSTEHADAEDAHMSTAKSIRAVAEKVFKTAVAIMGTAAQYEMYEKKGTDGKNEVHAVSDDVRHFEVVGIDLPSAEISSLFACARGSHDAVGAIEPLGILRVKPWSCPWLANSDAAFADADADASGKRGAGAAQEFWLEADLLRVVAVGMRMECTVRTLDIGIAHLDAVHGVFPSFYTLLENEKMARWRAPEANLRPAPSVAQPDVEEMAMGGDGDDE